MTTAPTPGEEPDLEAYAALLEATGQYRVLRQLPPLNIQKRMVDPRERIVAIVDTETTGLDPNQDEVIEFAGIAVTYNPNGDFTGIISSFSQLQEPRVPLSTDTVRLTGITKAMLEGRKIDKDSLDRFVDAAHLIVAHNASFDRPFCESLSDVFKTKPWACSATEIDWNALGFDGAKLTYLVAHTGWFYEAHRALDDCNALARVLGTPLVNDADRTPFKQLLNSARESKTRVSFPAPYGLRTTLRAKGFRWRSSRPRVPGNWYADISEQDVPPTLDWLLSQMNISRASIRLSQITAFERYRQG
jgi:DNA polymerase-3 subunit epsilon